MSTIKATTRGVTQFWWGYTTQVNMSKKLEQNNLIQQFMSIKGQDVANPDNTYLNFWCWANKDTTGAPRLVETRDCGENDITKTIYHSSDEATVSDIAGDNVPYTGARRCPHYETATSNVSFWTTNTFVKSDSDWYSHTCSAYRSSLDETELVSGYSVGTQI